MKKTIIFMVFIFMAFLIGCEKEEMSFLNDQDTVVQNSTESLTESLTGEASSRSENCYEDIIAELEDLVYTLIDEGYLNPPKGNGLLPQLKNIERKMSQDKMDDALDMLSGFRDHLEGLHNAGKIPAEEYAIFLDLCQQLENCIIGVVIVLDEDFESYAAGTFPASGGWILRYNGLGTPYQVISTEKAISGTKSFKMEGRPGWAALAYYNFGLAELPEEIYLETNINTQGFPPFIGDQWWSHAAFNLGDPNYPPWGMAHTRLIFRNDQQIWLGPNYSYVGDFVDDQWYKARIKYNRISKHAWLWIDDVLVAEDLDLSGSLGDYNSVSLVSENGAYTKTFFDDLKIWYVP